MDFSFSGEQELLRSAARNFLTQEYPLTSTRRIMEMADAYDSSLWEKIGALGWTGLGIPEAFGGVGSLLDLVVVMEETGRTLLPGPFFSTMGLAVPTIMEAGSEDQKEKVLGAVSAGHARGSLALTEEAGRWDPKGVRVQAVRSVEGWHLQGEKVFVPDARMADYLIVVARTEGEGAGGVSLFLVDDQARGMVIEPMSVLDQTRQWYRVILTDVVLPADALLGRLGDGWASLSRALEWGLVALCAEMVGAAQYVLDTSSAYAKNRNQFGKPIGTYQAISHRLADMALEIESGRAITYYAAWAVSTDAPDRSQAVSIAKAYVSDAFRRAAGAGIHIHGGIGFTWENDMQLFFKRAKADEVMLGDATYHRELVAQTIGL